MKIAWLTWADHSDRAVVEALAERHEVTVLAGASGEGNRLLQTPDEFDLVVYRPGPDGPEGDAIRAVAALRPGVVLLDDGACTVPSRSLGVVVESDAARQAIEAVSPAPVVCLGPAAARLEEFLLLTRRQALYLGLTDTVSDVLGELGPDLAAGLTERLVTEIARLHGPERCEP